MLKMKRKNRNILMPKRRNISIDDGDDIDDKGGDYWEGEIDSLDDRSDSDSSSE